MQHVVPATVAASKEQFSLAPPKIILADFNSRRKMALPNEEEGEAARRHHRH